MSSRKVIRLMEGGNARNRGEFELAVVLRRGETCAAVVAKDGVAATVAQGEQVDHGTHGGRGETSDSGCEWGRGRSRRPKTTQPFEGGQAKS